MTFTLGTSKLSYAYFGDWTRSHTVTVDTVTLIGEPSSPGDGRPGAMRPGTPGPTRVKVNVEVA